ncbi:hypothetical protein E4U41_005910 [Claviceps citrina]|nr:hypothetical protein E4U41_005910 [Claviceps citrina]
MDRDKDDGKVGWGRRVDARFAIPASRNLLGRGSTPLSLENTFMGRTLRKGNCLEPIQGSSLEQSVGSRRDVSSEALKTPTPAGDQASGGKAATDLVRKSQEVDATLFPSGSVMRTDGRCRRSQDEATQLCHSCGKPLPHEQHCGICGHDYCYKCASERLKRDAGPWTDSSRRAARTEIPSEGPDANAGDTSVPPTPDAKAIPKTPIGGPVTGNPFFLADRFSKGTSSAPHKATVNMLAIRPRRLSECVPRRFVDESPRVVATYKPKSHQDHKQDDSLQDMERHSLCCSAKMRPMSVNINREVDGMSNRLQSKIGKLCRHAEEFHRSHNTLGHNGTRLEYWSRSRDSMTHASVTTAAEETPTRLPRRPRPSSLEDKEDDTADTAEHRDQESALRPEPLTLRPKNADAIDSSGSKSSRGKDVLDIDSVPGTGHDKVVPEQPVDSLPVATSAENDVPSLTGYKRHRQDTYLCPRPQTANSEPEAWPSLRRVGVPGRDGQPWTQPLAPWSRQSLRRVSSSVGCLHLPRQTVDSPISPRDKGDGRRKGRDTAQFTAPKMMAATSPISDWRRNLVKAQEHVLNPPQINILCESCNLTDSRSRASHDEASEGCSHRSISLARSAKDTTSNLEDPFREPRLSIRTIENSLGWKKVQEDFEKDNTNGEAEACSSRRRSATTASDQSARERTAGECSDSCSWRNRYLKLRDEILKSGDLLALCQGDCERKGNEGLSRYEGTAADELGIEALTVVVHMRERDNLVIKTDLGRRQNGRD